MRPLIFHLADNAMVEGLKGFFGRDNWHHALGCAQISIDPENNSDFFKVPGANDQAIWKRAHENLMPFPKLYERAIIILDEHFDPSPGAAVLEQEIAVNMEKSGWKRERFEVIVIQPMLEAWLWMDNPNIAAAFGVESYEALKSKLIAQELWEEGAAKPHELKRAVQVATGLGKIKSGRKTFSTVFGAASRRALDACEEPGFKKLRQTLQSWFPAEGGQA
ncbi:MAG: hypothetical protein JJT75_09155 [Opitutales bacterium]|nr:hypothetical protein [Opitutales bacterium]